MDELLLVRMLDEDVSTKELGLDPSPPFFFLSRLRTWQSRTLRTAQVPSPAQGI